MSENDPPFTMSALVWHPRISWVEIESAEQEQRDALLKSGKASSGSLYSRTLAHDPPSLVTRAALYDLVMYAPEGLDSMHRELAALTVSMINGCRYCASVHSRRLAQLSKNRAGVQEILAGGPGLTDDPRAAALARVAIALTDMPSSFGPEHVIGLRDEGWTDVEIFDAVNVSAMFAWANRLMQTLGDSSAAQPVKLSS